MITLDFSFGPLAAVLCLIAYFWLLVRFPTGVVFIGLTTYGIAWVEFGPINYARAVAIIQFLSAAYFFYHVVRAGRLARIMEFMTSRHSIMIWFLLIVWIKISFDVLHDGLDEIRTDALKVALQSVFLPLTVFFLSLVSSEPWRFSIGILVGMVAFSIAFVAPAIPGMILEGRIIAAVTGTDRLTIYNMDTINGGRFFFMGAVGALGLISSGVLKRGYVLVLAVLFVSFSVLMILNGTRQFAMGLLIASVMCSYSLFKKGNVIRLVMYIVLAGLIAHTAVQYLQSAALTERLTVTSLTQEAEASRGAIWRQAFEIGLEHPLTGVGFRKFGEIVIDKGQSGEEDVVVLSGAHGFFQDILAEHGLILSFIGLVCFFICVFRVMRRVNAGEHSVIWTHFAALMSMLVPLFFSGYVFTSAAMHFFAASMYVLFAKHKIDLAQQHLIRIEAMREAEARKKQKDILKGRA